MLTTSRALTVPPCTNSTQRSSGSVTPDGGRAGFLCRQADLIGARRERLAISRYTLRAAGPNRAPSLRPGPSLPSPAAAAGSAPCAARTRRSRRARQPPRSPTRTHCFFIAILSCNPLIASRPSCACDPADAPGSARPEQLYRHSTAHASEDLSNKGARAAGSSSLGDCRRICRAICAEPCRPGRRRNCWETQQRHVVGPASPRVPPASA